MKYSYLILLGLLALAPATYAEGAGNTDQLSMTQTDNITVKGKIVDETGAPLPGATVQQKYLHLYRVQQTTCQRVMNA